MSKQNNALTLPSTPHSHRRFPTGAACGASEADHQHTMPDWRDAGAVAIVAAAAGLGLALVKSSGWLLGAACQRVATGEAAVVTAGAAATAAAKCAAMSAGPVLFGLRGWQCLTIAAFAVGPTPEVERFIFLGKHFASYSCRRSHSSWRCLR
jgi:hypothetical protein